MLQAVEVNYSRGLAVHQGSWVPPPPGRSRALVSLQLEEGASCCCPASPALRGHASSTCRPSEVASAWVPTLCLEGTLPRPTTLCYLRPMVLVAVPSRGHPSAGTTAWGTGRGQALLSAPPRGLQSASLCAVEARAGWREGYVAVPCNQLVGEGRQPVLHLPRRPGEGRPLPATPVLEEGVREAPLVGDPRQILLLILSVPTAGSTAGQMLPILGSRPPFGVLRSLHTARDGPCTLPRGTAPPLQPGCAARIGCTQSLPGIMSRLHRGPAALTRAWQAGVERAGPPLPGQGVTACP